MKYLLLLFLFTCINSFSQNEGTYIIEGIQMNCETNSSDNRERNIKLKKDDNIIADNIKSRFDEFKIKNLKKDKYTLELTNIFGQIITQEIELKDSITKINLCIDKFIDTKQKTLLEKLSQKDTLEILITSSGCFHFEKEKITYYYKNQKLIAEYFKNGKRKKRLNLDKNKLNELIVFERKVIAMKNSIGGCTSSTQYIFMLNGVQNFEVDDSSCDWGGYYKIKKEIFGVK